MLSSGFSVDFSANPAAHLSDLRLAIKVAAGKLAKTIHSKGLNHFEVTLTNQEYMTLHADEDPVMDPLLLGPVDDPTIHRLVPTIPIYPDNPTTAQNNTYQHKVSVFEAVDNAITVLVELIILWTGRTIIDDIIAQSEPTIIESELTPWFIITYLHRVYGQMTKSGLIYFRDQLKMKCPSEGEVINHLAKMKKIMATMGRNRDQLSESAQVDAGIAATSHIPAMSIVIMEYLKANPTLDTQDFNTFEEYTINHLPNISRMMIEQSLFGMISAVSVIKPSTSKDSPHITSTKTQVKSYCFVHGYGHSGHRCRIMLNEDRFSKAHLAATGPCTINGEVGSTRGAPLSA